MSNDWVSQNTASAVSNLSILIIDLNTNIVNFNEKSEKYTKNMMILTVAMLIVAALSAILVGCQIYLIYNPPSAR